MKRFHFPLDRVRRWREGQAGLEEMKLEQLRGNWEALREERQNIETERTRSEQEVLGQSTIGASELQSLDAYRLHSRARIRDIENREGQAETLMAQQGQRVIEARRNAELLERLKQKAREEWQAASDKEQESFAAELYLGRWMRRR
jgi:flagellar biosynthesis chaperone FliJ